MSPPRSLNPPPLSPPHQPSQPDRVSNQQLAAAVPAAILLAITALAAVLFYFPPDRYSFYPRCPIYTYLHLQCPGCGTTRALAALLHGHFIEALHLNPLTTLLLPIVLLYAARSLWRQRSQPIRWPQPPAYAVYALLVISAIFTAARNLIPNP